MSAADKLYSNPTTYPNIYNRAPCAKQGVEANQQFYSYNMPSTTHNQSNNILEPFNNVISPQQNCNTKNQNLCMYSTNQLDMMMTPNWSDDIKIPDKIEMIEITSKDLSPAASYCSNLDVFMPDFYKSITKELNYYNKIDGQWFSSNNTTANYNSQKIEYPSCAQQNTTGTVDKTVKYCSIQTMQKTQQDFDYNNKNYGLYNDLTSYSDYYKNPLENKTEFYSNYCDKISEQYFELPPSFQHTLDQQTECSNEESDIIVEESDEELNCSDFDNKKKFPSEANKCIICNISYTPLGIQFYYLTLKSPLTMSSQKPVFMKITNIIGRIPQKINYLCSECLGLINTIDHLQLKLENFNSELVMKFRKTCQDNHMKPHQKKSPSKRFKCKLCKKVLTIEQWCQFHRLRHHNKGILCELCGVISKTHRHFRQHYQHKHGVKKNPKIHSYQCGNCPRIFRTKSNREEHENYCLNRLPFCCQSCDKKFPSQTKLKNHVKLKHDKKFVAICSICNIGFVKLSDYKAHKVSHSTDKKFACTKCEKSYKTLSNLNFHMKLHNNKLPFNCDICHKGFMRKEYLEAHVNNHKGLKNFPCGLCQKKFVSQKNLDSHLKYHDGSAKRKTCNVCGKVITTNFEEHLRIHNNLKEFECDQCDMRFNTKGTLSKHKKRKHNLDLGSNITI